MNIIDIINKKRLNQSLSIDELKASFLGYLNNEVKDYQMSSLLMAININGLNDEEIINLTNIFVNSGDVLNFNHLGLTADKHSTGGVGDKVTLILGPILAACGIKFPKMSGRGLGYTGGTIDKLESIPGFNVNLTKDQIYHQIEDIGISISSQTNDLVPLDKVIYDLRNSSGTVMSIPLIAISIMSKKIACGSKTILIDIKCGNGALIKDMNEANELSRIMQLIAKSYDLNIITEITDMNNPLGNNIGNALEVVEALQILNGKDCELTKLVINLSSKIIMYAKKINHEDALLEVINSINNKNAYNKFLEVIKYQGGRIEELKLSDQIIEVRSNKSGILKEINALNISKLAFNLGAGRLYLEDEINYGVGIELIKNINDQVNINDVLCKLYINHQVNYNIDDIFRIE